MFAIVLFHGCQKLLLRFTVVLVWHTHVPQYIVVANFRHQLSARHLRVVVIRPYSYQLKLPCLAVEVHLKIVIVRLSQSRKLAVLKRNSLLLTCQLILVRIEAHPAVREVVYVKWLAVIALFRHLPHRAHLARAPGIYAAECVLLVVIIYAIFVSVHFHKLPAAWQHQTAVTVLFRIYVAGAAYWEQSRVEFVCVAGVSLYARQSLAVAQLYLITVLTSADVHRLPFYPPLGSATHFLGYLLQGLVAVFPLIVYHYQL